MGGTASGTASNTYPAPMVAALVADPLDYGEYSEAGSPLTVTGIPVHMIPNQASFIAGYPTYGSYASNVLSDGYTFWYNVDPKYGSPSSGIINGSATDQSAGQLVYYFKEIWNGYGAPTLPMPDHIYLLLKTQVYASAGVDYNRSGLTSGLSASASASDGPPYNEAVSASSNAGVADRPGYFLDSHQIIGYHLVKASVNPLTAIAPFSLSGTVNQAASNGIPAGVYDPDFGYITTYGSTEASADSWVDGGVKLDAAALNGTYINKDLPIDTTYQGLPYPTVLYGGSVRFTSDELLLNAADSPPIPGTTYTWAVYGPGGYTPPSNVPTWNVIIAPTPGIVTFECAVQPPAPALPSAKTLTIEVGIRTDDTIMVGWIDTNGVTVPSGLAALAAGVDPQVLSEFAPGAGSGPPGSDSNYPFTPPVATAAIAALAANDDCIDWELPWPSHPYSQVDKDFILNWMFKYAPNLDPTSVLSALHTTDWTNPNFPLPTLDNPNPVPVNTSSDFTCYAGYMDYLKYQAYLADAHHFKLLNHFQVKYRVNLTNPFQFNGTPILLQHEALIGATVNPTGIPPDLGPALNYLANLPPPFNIPYLADAYANHTLNDPQAGPANGNIGEDPNQTLISQSNDGSPEIPAVRAFNTLMALDVQTPLFWQNIGSKITFKCGQATAINPPITENYPTYYQYANGIQVFVRPQAGTPKGHFFANAYPFGEYSSYGLPPQWPGGLPVLPSVPPFPNVPSFPTIPGGRNGVATTPGDGSSPTPPYTVP